MPDVLIESSLRLRRRGATSAACCTLETISFLCRQVILSFKYLPTESKLSMGYYILTTLKDYIWMLLFKQFHDQNEYIKVWY